MKRIVITSLYAGFIFYLSSRPWNGLSFLPEGFDKVIHLGIYFLLGGLILWALRSTKLKYQSYTLWISIALGSLYGASDEFHQSFVPGRSADVYDLLMDIIGVSMGVLAAHTYLKRVGRVNATN